MHCPISRLPHSLACLCAIGDLDPDLDPDPNLGHPLTPSAPPGRPDDNEWIIQHRGPKILSPPLALVGESVEQRSRSPFMRHSVPPMTEAVARQALLRFVASRCCYGSRAVGELAIRRLRPLGTYRTRCVTCKGSCRRLKQQKRCQLCSGTGRKRCNTCSGRGSKTCVTCQGEKKLQHFKQLVITWKNNVFEFVSEHHLNFPGELLSKVSGANIFKDENVVVYPIIDFPDPEISLASQRAITEHSAALATSSRILRQRQTIELIPITEVHYQYSGKPYLYYIYGLENKVYALDYPERCCCSCTIL
ncbi:protein SSUH2 homolog isoform X4 [Athene noctua]|uniref:protein SSUH2 homolog isoform X4 n=1 Tax=Athene noctua TaxID=126797 RepID=UPI003EC04387